MQKFSLIFGLLALLFVLQQAEQVAAAKSFAFACGQLLGGITTGECTVMLHSYTDATALLRSSSDTIGTEYSITAGQTLDIDIDGTERVVSGTEDKTFYITSDDDITVHVSNTGASTTYSVIDAVELYAQDAAGDTDFYIVNLGSPDTETGCAGYTAFYSVCAYADGTTVSVYRKESGSLVLDGTYTLNEFDVFTERESASGLIEENFSGYVIRASQNVSVYAGNRCYTHTTSHSTWSSILPVHRLGTTYASYDLDTDDYQFMIKVVATDNATDVSSASAGVQVTLDEADVTEFVYAGSALSVIQCSKPCIVMQIVNGTSSDSGVSQQVLNPVDSMVTQGLFSIPTVYLESSYDALVLHIIHNSDDGQGLTLNGASLDGLSWQAAGDGYVYATDTLTFALDPTYDIVSSTAAFSALVTGVDNTQKGFMFNVAHSSSSVAPTPPPDAPTPQHSIVLSGSFSSSDGSDFTIDCSAQYQQELFEKAVTVSADVNGMIGTTFCAGLTSDDIFIETITTQFSPNGSAGSNVITHYLTADAAQSPSAIEACAVEIAEYLTPHANWGEPILPTLPDCPGVVYSSNMWNHDGNEWVCLDASHAAGPPPTRQVSLAYGLVMLGAFETGAGENLTVECRNVYTEDFLFATLDQTARVNAELGSTLCSGVDIVIDDSSVTLNSFQSQGETTQEYSFALGGDIAMSEVTVCVNEVSAYLADHSNWRQPIIETDPPCPAIVFNPASFTEETQQWLCRE